MAVKNMKYYFVSQRRYALVTLLGETSVKAMEILLSNLIYLVIRNACKIIYPSTTVL